MGNEPLEHVLVLSVSTMPSMGFKARLAIPVLKAIEVMSRMAVPVVSEPVPAVVGTTYSSVRGSSTDYLRRQQRTCNERVQLLCDG